MARTHGAELSEAERFWARVDPQGECLIWTGTRNGYGYGRFPLDNRRAVFAHRYAYELEKGAIPEGLTIDHLCRNRACVNIDHLEAVTNHENLMRGVNQVAFNARKTHCLRGHAFTAESTYVRANGDRVCRPCANLRRRLAAAPSEAPDNPVLGFNAPAALPAEVEE